MIDTATKILPSDESLRPGIAYLLVWVAIGLVFMVAGAGKTTGGKAILLASGWVVPAGVVVVWGLVESVVGWAVLTFCSRRSLRYLLIVIFATFVGLLLVEWLSGSATFPCAGNDGLPIEHVFLFAVLALFSLIAFREQWDRSKFAADTIATGIVGTLKYIVPVALAIAVILFGSPASALGFLSGRSLLVDQAERFVGNVVANEKITTTFRLQNASSLPIHVLGARSSCGCVAIQDLPATVPPWESHPIRISLNANADPVAQRETAHLICDDSIAESVLGVTALVHPNRIAVDANIKLGGR